MKKIIFSLLAVIFISMGLNAQTTYWIPEGSKTEINGNKMKVTPPTGYSYLAKLNTGTVVELISGNTICCDCTSGSGQCMPAIGGGHKGCFLSGCTKCDASASITYNGTDQKILEGGYVNFSLGVKVETQNLKLPQIFTSAFQNEKFKKGLDAFINKIYLGQTVPTNVIVNGNTSTAPEGYKFVYVNAYGRGLFLVVPNTFQEGLRTASISCACSNGSCSAKSQLGVAYCEGDCSGVCCGSGITTGGNILIQHSQF
jgi:hypothetical protein